MRYPTANAVMLAALALGEAVAGPTHAHIHRHAAHEKKAVDWAALDWDNMGIDWVAAYKAGQAAKSAAAAAPAPAPVATTATTATVAAAVPAGTSTASSAEGLWNGVVGASNSLTEFGGSTAPYGSDVSYVGNIGAPQGSNIIKVLTTDGYDFTNNFINTSPNAMTVMIWNKAASQGLDDSNPVESNLGSCIAPHIPALSFALAPGESQIVAFAENTQIGWAEATDATAESGAFAISWGEANFVSTGSGYDLSAIMNAAGNNYNMAITSLEAPECTSDMTQNYWLTASQPIGDSDGSCYIAQNTATLTTHMGGSV